MGELLAARLGVPFRDTDADIERAQGRTVTEIFATDGETAFRELEAEAVRSALADHEGVLALGGGAVLTERTRQLLTSHFVVLLDVAPDEAARRIGAASSRPLLSGPAVEDRLLRLAEERSVLYRRVAVLCSHTTGRAPEPVADSIARLVRAS
ncbi:shikimate kinase [Streptomyces sp. W16]|uniref:shikimate kinase n=1 Tax=Streptomyces sp. W16 TaxID=3076631 RepID=UPI00295B8C8D|nr:shikimate kinase [Streptomyces sp. W16]MDV9169072.1 shikimate kinase [Streptomyces sp. W16]